MNDRHPSGLTYPTGPADGVQYSSYGTPSYAADVPSHADHGGYGYDPYGQAAAYDSGRYETTSWDSTPAHGIPRYDPSQNAGQQPHGWDSGTWESGDRSVGGIPEQTASEGWDTGGYSTGPHGGTSYDTTQYADTAYDTTPSYGDTAYDTAAYDTALYSDATQYGTGQYSPGTYDNGQYAEGQFDPTGQPSPESDTPNAAQQSEPGPEYAAEFAPEHGSTPEDGFTTEPTTERLREFVPSGGDVLPPRPPQGRGRRRSPKPRRSALLTVAAPSLCVLGVTAVAAAATVSGNGTDTAGDDVPLAAPDPDSPPEPVAANKEFDTQLASLTAAADDYADRASRTQGRIDLEEKKAEEKRKAEEKAAKEAAEREAEAARAEELRPKFVLPVERRGLSAYYGQSGINWMSQHTGIDFPVRYGTPVMAATDGNVRTQWHSSYGNMAIVTAADGTETWYSHLSSTAYQSGWVKAGTVIAYSGNSGNSTGPHLHFEVRPGGGSAIDPLAWFRSKGLEPT
ncbi:peptidoglycan DD-metalloendopeptidase family protein [Streptomyces sp. ACA25]|uniref:M23 family metallopeptidase n=1 Tax=Streptomyces sp. ACA25 TaxID=3022596 RepID=UPI002307CEDE|nr:peptidoglycan DD-metalloendopeptidase family protein [Streptomyces sp. ACA25]MDB1087378.1 peptidoglycan DD-metalloendopeptidase family protein [Streptomyces sp. ACA25]